jgi:hypothetical protein
LCYGIRIIEREKKKRKTTDGREKSKINRKREREGRNKKKRERNEDVNKEVKTLQDLLASANIKPNQETSAGNVEKGSFGIFIAKIENEKPIFDWEKDLGGEDKLKKILNIFFFGNLAKVLNIRNPWDDEFKEEMGKFTVDMSEVEKEKESEDLLGNV